MNTLEHSSVAPLLDRLFAEAENATSPAMSRLSSAEQDRLVVSKTEYRELYTLMKDLWLPVSREAGMLLYMLARSSRAKAIVEFGTSFGISTLYLAASLRDNGGGRLMTSEFEPSKVVGATRHLSEAGLIDLVEIREGDALKTLSVDLPDSIDLLLLDGAKSLYPQILDLVEARLRPGAMVVADDAGYCPEYLARVRLPGGPYLSLPFADDIELSIRL